MEKRSALRAASVQRFAQEMREVFPRDKVTLVTNSDGSYVAAQIPRVETFAGVQPVFTRNTIIIESKPPIRPRRVHRRRR